MTDSNAATNLDMTGVPLGGVGTGYVEIDRRGRFRNFAINNNRTSDSILPSAEGCFLGLRVAHNGEYSACILQTETGLPFADGGLASACINKRVINWKPLYP